MERDEIFKHVDPDTDRLNVWPNTLGGLRFNVEQEDDASNVDLDVAAVSRIHTALGAWLAANGITQRATVGLSALPDADGIRTMVREEFEKLFNDRTRPAVLPLWESPASGAVSRPCGGCAEEAPTVGPEHCTECGHTWIQHNFAECMEAKCTCTRTRMDRATSAPVPDPAECTCSHVAGSHNEHGCYSHLCPCTWRRSTSVPDPADVPEIMAAPRLMSAVRRRSARTPIHCERCSHLYADHDDVDGCTYEYESTNRQCGCTWSTG